MEESSVPRQDKNHKYLVKFVSLSTSWAHPIFQCKKTTLCVTRFMLLYTTDLVRSVLPHSRLVLWCLTPLSTIYQLYIVMVSFIGGGNRGTRRKPPTCRKSLTNFITWCCIKYTSLWTELELTTIVVIGTDCTGSCISNYLTITDTMAPPHSTTDDRRQ